MSKFFAKLDLTLADWIELLLLTERYVSDVKAVILKKKI